MGTQAGVAHSEGEPSTGIVVSPILATALEETEDRPASLALVTLQPNAVSAPHRHRGTVIVYVLEGEVESALDDEAPQTFVAGQTWKEHPGAVLRLARNKTQSVAKILAVLIHGEGDALERPVQ